MNKLNKILAGGMACALLTLIGCGASQPAAASSAAPASSEAQSADLLAQIQEKGEIVVAMEGNWTPWTYHDESDELVGYDVEVAQGIAEYLGVKATFVEGVWDGLFAGLDSGRYDMVVNGVDITPDRLEKYDFSDPYGYIHTALAVRGDNTDITSFEDLNGKTTANSIGSTYMELAEQYGATVSGVDTLDETIEVLLQGRVDATLNADVSFFDYLNTHPETDIKLVTESEEANQVAIPLRKGDETATLRAAVNEALAAMRESGKLAELSQKYFGADISQEQ